jgi:hypothetical protein
LQQVGGDRQQEGGALQRRAVAGEALAQRELAPAGEPEAGCQIEAVGAADVRRRLEPAQSGGGEEKRRELRHLRQAHVEGARLLGAADAQG